MFSGILRGGNQPGSGVGKGGGLGLKKRFFKEIRLAFKRKAGEVSAQKIPPGFHQAGFLKMIRPRPTLPHGSRLQYHRRRKA